jgi:hypothetical protein
MASQTPYPKIALFDPRNSLYLKNPYTLYNRPPPDRRQYDGMRIGIYFDDAYLFA